LGQRRRRVAGKSVLGATGGVIRNEAIKGTLDKGEAANIGAVIAGAKECCKECLREHPGNGAPIHSLRNDSWTEVAASSLATHGHTDAGMTVRVRPSG
jgi:hypothetical protein